MDNEYATEQCSNCVHGEVCRFEQSLNQIAEITPFDFSTVTCAEYLSELEYGDEECECDSIDEVAKLVHKGSNIQQSSVYGAIVAACSALVEHGYTPHSVLVNAKTQDLMIQQLSKGLGNINDIDTPFGSLEVLISEHVPDGQVHINVRTNL